MLYIESIIHSLHSHTLVALCCRCVTVDNYQTFIHVCTPVWVTRTYDLHCMYFFLSDWTWFFSLISMLVVTDLLLSKPWLLWSALLLIPLEFHLVQMSPSVWRASSWGAWPADPKYWLQRLPLKPEPDDWTKAEGTTWGSYDVLCKCIKKTVFEFLI